MTEATTTDIAKIVAANPVAVLVDPKMYDALHRHIKAEADAFIPDLSTAMGRGKIASLAYKVTRTKTAIDNAGKKLNEDARKQISSVDELRRKIRGDLDSLVEQVRKPLNEWEAAEESRVAHCKQVIDHIREVGKGTIGGQPQPFGLLLYELNEKIIIDDTFGEFGAEARQAREEAIERLNAAMEAQKKADAERAELESLRAAEKERKAVEAVAAEAERQKKKAAEQEAARVESERLAQERAAALAEKAADAARQDERRIATEAVAKAEREKQALIAAQQKAEADRAADVARQAKEQADRESDEKHRAEVIDAAAKAMAGLGLPLAAAMVVLSAIIAGDIPNVSLRF